MAALSAFEDKAHRPAPAEVRAVLGPAAPLWDRLVAFAVERCGPLRQAWGYPGAKYGWSLRLEHEEKARRIAYLTPCAGHFLVGVVLGDKAVAEARAAGRVPEAVLRLVEAAPRYPEGRGVRVEVADEDALHVAEALVAIKVPPP